jgi:hypothetical protein
MIFWIYDLPTWAFGILTVSFVAMVSCGGLLLSRSWIRKQIRLSDDTNEVVNAYFAGVGVLYGLLLGLVAVATWQNFDDASALISKEAAALGALYRDVSGYPEPLGQKLQSELRQYTVDIIDQAWPEQQQGRVPTGGNVLMSQFERTLLSFEPASAGQTVLHEEAFRAFNYLIEIRRLRLDAVDGGLPGVLWSVVLIGAALSIGMTYFFHLGDQKLHLILTGILGAFIGLMVFLTAAVDNPFRGEVSVSADSYRLLLDTVMKQGPPSGTGNRSGAGGS